MKNLWKVLGAVGSTLIALLLLMLGKQKKIKDPDFAATVITNNDKLGKDIKDITEKPAEQIIEELPEPQKDILSDVVSSQVDSAMKDAQKFRRKKP